MKKALFVMLILGVLIFTACGNRSEGAEPIPAFASVPAEFVGKTNPLGADAASAGVEVYKTYCASCHGDTGLGDGHAGGYLQPTPKNLVEFQPQVGDDYLFWRISTGKSGTAMVAWKGMLTEGQIWQVISFIRTLK